MSDIGTRLRQERKRLGLSQREMGQLGGVAANAQGKYESGERVPKADYLAAVANSGVDVLYILTDKHAFDQPLDMLVGSITRTSGEPADMFVEVQQAVRQLVTAIEQISNSYEVDEQLLARRRRSLELTAHEKMS